MSARRPFSTRRRRAARWPLGLAVSAVPALRGSRAHRGVGFRRLLALTVSVAVLVSLAEVPAGAASSTESVAPAVAAATPAETVRSRPDRVSAGLAARAQGSRVEVSALTSESSVTYVNSDGSSTTEVAGAPVRVRDGAGWQPVDLSLVPDGAGGWAPKAAPSQVRFSGGGVGPAASIAEGSDGLTLGWLAGLPAPQVVGGVARYALDATSTLVLATTAAGFTARVELSARPTQPLVLRLPLKLTGKLSVVRADDGSLSVRTAAGKALFAMAAPSMWGADVDPRTGDPLHVAPVQSRIVTVGGGQQLELTAALSFLADPAVQLPITIDPDIASVTRLRDTYVETDVSTDQGGASTLRAGRQGNGAIARSFLQFDTGAVSGTHVVSATLGLYNYDSTGGCTASTTYVYPVTAAWTNPIGWATQPPFSTSSGYAASKSFAHDGVTAGCPAATEWLDVTAMTAAWAAGTLPNFGMEVSAPETDSNAQKRFCSMNPSSVVGATCGSATLEPTMSITYNHVPGPPSKLGTAPTVVGTTGNTYVTSLAPTLSGVLPDPDGGSLTAQFEVWHDPAAVGEGTGMIWTGSSSVAAGASASVTVPASTTVPGGHELWHVRGFDGTDYGPWSATQSMHFNTYPPVKPTISCPGYPAGAWTAKAAGSVSCTLDTTSGDGAGFFWSLDNPTPTTLVNDASNSGAALTVAISPAEGQHTLYALTRDSALLRSPVSQYTFGVGTGAVLSPADGDRTQAGVALTAQADPVWTGVTYKWHAGTDPAKTFTTVPAGDVTLPGSTTTLSGWPQTRTDGSAFGQLDWNMAKTMAAAGLGDGAFQLEACFTGSGTTLVCSTPNTITLARTAFGDAAATEPVGPGTVSLLTGDFSVDETDAAFGGLSVGRTATSLAPPTAATGPAGIFGPGWAGSLPGPDAGAADSTLTDHSADGYVVLTGGDGDETVYTKNASTGSYVGVDEANDGSTISPATVPDPADNSKTIAAWQLTDADGTVTTWTLTGGVWTALSVNEPGSEATSTFTRNSAGQVTRILAPVPAGVSCGTTLAAGCQALTLAYTASTAAKPTGDTEPAWGPYPGLVDSVSYTAYDPASSAMTTRLVASYAYDSTGHLRAQWDPRVSPALKTRYSYDTAGRLATLTPPGLAAWTMHYDSKGRLKDVTRVDPANGAATEAVVYGVAITGTGAPIDLSGAQTTTWGQRTDLPWTGAGVFPASHVPPVNTAGDYAPAAADWPFASLSYLDINGRVVNTAGFGAGAWQLDSTRFDGNGNVVWSLDAGNRAQALTPTASTDPYVAAQGDTATRADLLAQISTFTADGVDLLTSDGPAHPVQLDSGRTASVRVRTSNSYDQGAPAGGPFHLVTTTTESPVVLDGTVSSAADSRTTLTGYAPVNTGDTSGWTLRTPTKTTTVMGTTAGTTDIVRTVSYDAAGRTVASTMPESNGADAGTTVNTYYTAAANITFPSCGGKPQWAGNPCRSGPKAQPTSGPTIPVTETTYDLWGSPDLVTETSGTTTRTSNPTFDGAGRPTSVSTVVTPAADGGTAVPAVSTSYDTATGLALSVSDGTSTVRTGYDSLGRATSYTDADGAVTTTAYRIDGQAASRSDGKGSYSYSYDGTDAAGKVEHRGLLTRLDAGMTGQPSVFTGAYDPAGALVSQTYPNGLVATGTFDNTGDARTLDYTKGGTSWLSFTSSSDSHGQTVGSSSPQSGQDFGYDNAGRLTTVTDTNQGVCAGRSYAFNKNSDRSSLTTTPAAADGSCATTGASTVNSTFDEVDRLTTAGYSYDKFGRSLTVPAADVTGGGSLSVGYYATDMVRSQTQGTSSKVFTLDPARRLRQATDSSTTGGTATETRRIVNHYADGGDSPAWISTSTDGGATSSWQRNVQGLTGLAALQDSAGTVTLQLTNLHGDIVATVDDSSTATSTTAYFEQTEYGAPRDSNPVNPTRYGWLGSHQRSNDDLGGLTLMGVRLYNPATGRFLSVDPVPGGNDNTYTYPVNPTDMFDLDGRFGWKKWIHIALIVAAPFCWACGVAAVAWDAVDSYNDFRHRRFLSAFSNLALNAVPWGGGRVLRAISRSHANRALRARSWYNHARRHNFARSIRRVHRASWQHHARRAYNWGRAARYTRRALEWGNSGYSARKTWRD